MSDEMKLGNGDDEPVKAVIGQWATYCDTGMWTFKHGQLIAPEDLTTAQLKDHLLSSGGAVYLRNDGSLAWFNIQRWNQGMELPFATYERTTGEKWPGGKSEKVRVLLDRFGIKWPAGSVEANLCLQGALMAQMATRPDETE